MTTVELEARKREVLNDIMQIDSIEVLNAVIKAIKSQQKREVAVKLKPYTIKEINEIIDKSEADADTGRVIDSKEMSRRMNHFISEL